MKKLLIILILSTVVMKDCAAQTFSEWFEQKETQKKYLIEQIAALQTYLGYVQKGYSIAQKGLTTISNIKNGEFNLHTDYFNSLRSVNPNIKSCAKVADIIAMQLRIVQAYKNTYRQVREWNVFNSGEA